MGLKGCERRRGRCGFLRSGTRVLLYYVCTFSAGSHCTCCIPFSPTREECCYARRVIQLLSHTIILGTKIRMALSLFIETEVTIGPNARMLDVYEFLWEYCLPTCVLCTSCAFREPNTLRFVSWTGRKSVQVTEDLEKAQAKLRHEARVAPDALRTATVAVSRPYLYISMMPSRYPCRSGSVTPRYSFYVILCKTF